MASARLLFPLLLLCAFASARASPIECADGCEVPGASFAPAPLASPGSPSPLPLVESLGLCALGAAGVACGVILARRA